MPPLWLLSCFVQLGQFMQFTVEFVAILNLAPNMKSGHTPILHWVAPEVQAVPLLNNRIRANQLNHFRLTPLSIRANISQPILPSS